MKTKKSTVHTGKAVFSYTSKCCNAPATKEPVARRPEDIKENRFSECSLGHWSCTHCGKGCKVSRDRN